MCAPRCRLQLSLAVLCSMRKSTVDYFGKLIRTTDNSKVYDVTSYVEEHPGGDAILARAGGDSTQGFFGPQHATRVFNMIGDFYIGDLQK